MVDLTDFARYGGGVSDEFSVLFDAGAYQLANTSGFDQGVVLDKHQVSVAQELANDVGTATGNIKSIRFSPDGTRFFVLYRSSSNSDSALVQYAAATPHRIDNAVAEAVVDLTYLGGATGIERAAADIEFSRDGLTIFILNSGFNSNYRAFIRQATLTGAWDVATMGALDAGAVRETGSPSNGPFISMRWLYDGEVMVLKSTSSGVNNRIYGLKYNTAYDFSTLAQTSEMTGRGGGMLAADYDNNFLYQVDSRNFRGIQVNNVTAGSMLTEDSSRDQFFNLPADVSYSNYYSMIVEFVESGANLYEFGYGSNSSNSNGGAAIGEALVGRLVSCSPAYDVSIASGNRDWPTPPQFTFDKRGYSVFDQSNGVSILGLANRFCSYTGAGSALSSLSHTLASSSQYDTLGSPLVWSASRDGSKLIGTRYRSSNVRSVRFVVVATPGDLRSTLSEVGVDVNGVFWGDAAIVSNNGSDVVGIQGTSSITSRPTLRRFSGTWPNANGYTEQESISVKGLPGNVRFVASTVDDDNYTRFSLLGDDATVYQLELGTPWDLTTLLPTIRKLYLGNQDVVGQFTGITYMDNGRYLLAMTDFGEFVQVDLQA